MQMLDIDQLQTFLAVEKTMSFTKAGDMVAKTQSAVSMQIKKLEETVGHQLFIRQGRNIEVTAEGERLIGYARDIVETSNKALAAFDESALRGSVYLGTADDYAERFLPEILAGFSQSNPLVEVSVVCESTYALRERIRSGEIDVAIVTHNEAKSGSELLRREPLVWVTSSRHNVHKSATLPLALGSPHCVWRKTAIDMLQERKREHRILYTSYSASVVGTAVLSGLAVSVLPESALRPGMRILRESEGFPKLPDCLIGIMRSDRETDSTTEALITHIRGSLNSMSRPDFVSLPTAVDVETISRPARLSHYSGPSGFHRANPPATIGA